MSEAAALFGLSFAAATMLPLSSEAAFAGALYGGMDQNTALLAASCGNVLAVMLNYAMGRWLYAATHARLERSRWGAKALKWSHANGYWALLLSALPVVGDPLTLAAGVARLRLGWFVLIAGSLRVARYWLIMQAF